MKTIVNDITIATNIHLITIISDLKVSKNNGNTKNSNIKTKIVINTNFLSIFLTYHLKE